MFLESRWCELFDADEVWLMALCVPGAADLFDRAAIRRRYGLPDLDALWARAQREKLGPLFAWRCQRPNGWPEPLQSVLAQWPEARRLELRHTQTRQRKVAMAREVMLERLHTVLVECGTVGIIYKGCAYESSLYPAPGLRPMTDVDLLVPKSDFETVRQRLLAQGHTVLYRSTNEQCLREPHTGILLDLHNDISLVREGTLGVDELFARSKPLSDGSALRVLPLPVMFLLHLQHMRSHGLEPGRITLLQFAELALLWARIADEGREDELLRLVQRWQLQHLLVLGLLCMEAMQLTIPLPSSLEMMTHQGPLALAQHKALRWLLCASRRLTPIANQGHHVRDVGTLEEAWRRGLRVSMRMLSHDSWREFASSQKHYLERAWGYAHRRFGANSPDLSP